MKTTVNLRGLLVRLVEEPKAMKPGMFVKQKYHTRLETEIQGTGTQGTHMLQSAPQLPMDPFRNIEILLQESDILELILELVPTTRTPLKATEPMLRCLLMQTQATPLIRGQEL